MKKQSRTSKIAVLSLTTGALSLGSLFVLYIFQINTLTQQVYSIGKAEQHMQELKTETNVLTFKQLQTRGKESMADIAKTLGFEPVGQVSYLKEIKVAVAQNIQGR